MRIIAGQYKNHKIELVPSELTRETSDKVRGAVFNSLGQKVIDSVVLDCFAGSGGYGLEALSRGAKNITFIDNQVKAVKTIEININKLKGENQCLIIYSDWQMAIKRLAKQRQTFNLVLADPPYDFKHYELLINQLSDLMSDNTTLVLEVEKKTVIDLTQVKLKIYKEAIYGIKKILYFEK